MSDDHVGVRLFIVHPHLFDGIVRLMPMAMLCAVMWLLCHQYYGVYDDAVLYSFQALARIHPDLYANDVFVRFGSQDSFTLFTPLYATLIERWGLAPAGVAIVTLFNLWLLVAAGWVARAMGPSHLAWLAVGLVIAIPASYGAYNVFKVGEEFVSARLPAEALLVTAVALSLRGNQVGAFAVASLGALLHPLMALPVMAILVLQRIPLRLLGATLAATALAVVLVCAIAVWAPVGRLSLMDGAWLEIVQLRSNYLFMTLWPMRTFERILLVACTLSIALRSLRDREGQDLLRATLLALAGGLLVTLVSTLVPVALLLQLQPWRALWIATLLALITLPVIAVTCWREPWGRSAVLMLAAAWCLFDLSPHAAWLSLAAVAVQLLGPGSPRLAIRYLDAFAWGLVAITVAWIVAAASTSLTMDFHIGSEPFIASRLRSMFGLPAAAALTFAAAWVVLARARGPMAQGLLVAAAVAAIPFMARVAHAQWVAPLHEPDLRIGFEDWRQRIPIGSEVLWMWDTVRPWMTLERPSYLSYAQASGVVFSRETAALLAQRAEKVRPLASPEFVLGALFDERYLPKPLDIGLLQHICTDPELGYVVSTDRAGTPADMKEWPRKGEFLYLYDCGLARQFKGVD